MVADQQRAAFGRNVVRAEHSHAVADAREEPQEEPENHRFHNSTVAFVGKGLSGSPLQAYNQTNAPAPIASGTNWIAFCSPRRSEAAPTIDGLTASPRRWINRIDRAKALARSALGTELARMALIGPL